MTSYVVPRLAEQISARLPAGMRQELADRAASNGRSMNSEIVMIFAQALGFQGATAAGPILADARPAAVSNEPSEIGSSHQRL